MSLVYQGATIKHGSEFRVMQDVFPELPVQGPASHPAAEFPATWRELGEKPPSGWLERANAVK